MALFSVVIPNYNSFHLIGPCLKSLEEQTFGDLEVVIVDDCSTDGSFEKLLTWQKTTSLSAKILRQPENRGPGAARNTGMDHCTGEYVTFLDADDFFERDTLEALAPYASAGYDAVIYDAFLDCGDQSSPLGMLEMRGAEQGDIDSRTAFVYTRGSTMGKVYRLAFLRERDLRFGEYYCSEDIPFTKSALALSGRIFYLRRNLYHYVEIPTSVVHSKNWKWDGESNARTEQIMAHHLKGLDFDLENEACKLRGIYTQYIFIMLHEKRPAREIRAYIRSHYGKEAMKNPYISRYPRSRYWMMRLISTNFLPLIRLMNWYISRR